VNISDRSNVPKTTVLGNGPKVKPANLPPQLDAEEGKEYQGSR